LKESSNSSTQFIGLIESFCRSRVSRFGQTALCLFLNRDKF